MGSFLFKSIYLYMMEKIKLKLYEVYQLSIEIDGIKHKTLPLITKYWLNILGKSTNEIKTNIEIIREELVRKYGEVNEMGSFYIQPEIDSKPNPVFVIFYNEFNSFLNEEVEIEYNWFNISDFKNVEIDGNYEILFKLIKIDE